MQDTIQTRRLIMRPHRLEDFEPSAALWASEAVVRHISGKPSTLEQSWSRILRYIGHWAALGYGYWVVQELDTGRFIGEVGFADYHRSIEPSLDGTPELGWVVAPHAWGKGYATESVRAAIDWAQRRLDSFERIACIIAPENSASIRVADKCGFRLVAETTYLGEPTLLYDREIR